MRFNSLKKYVTYGISTIKSIVNGNFRIFKFYCPYCDKYSLFLKSGLENHLTKCLSCHASIISLSIIRTITKHRKKIALKRVYELSFHGVVFNYLEKNSENFYFSEFFPESKLRTVNGVRNEDVQNLSFSKNFFNLITSSEVFEHVPNYIEGFNNIYRVLKPGGFFIFTVPLKNSYGNFTKRICRLSNQGQLVWIYNPEYHDSRVSGIKSVPVFWHHSKIQIIADLKKVGFRKAYLQKIEWTSAISQIVIVAIK
jgi:SAM-dependent methyltransferase